MELVEAKNLIDSETASTIRSRKSREIKDVLHCNTDATHLQHNATNCNTDVEQSYATDEQSYTPVSQCDEGLEKELELDEKNIFEIYHLWALC